MPQPFFTADTRVKISCQGDAFFITSFRQLPEKVISERRVFCANLGIIICQPLVAASMEYKVINPTVLYPVGESVHVEIRAHIRDGFHGVIIVKQAVFWVMHHLINYFFYSFITIHPKSAGLAFPSNNRAGSGFF